MYSFKGAYFMYASEAMNMSTVPGMRNMLYRDKKKCADTSINTILVVSLMNHLTHESTPV